MLDKQERRCYSSFRPVIQEVIAVIKWKVRKIAEARGLNIGQLAERAEIAYSTALDLWHGRAERISLGVLNRVCNALDTNPCEVLEFTPGEMTEDSTEGPEGEAHGLVASVLPTGPSVFGASVRQSVAA